MSVESPVRRPRLWQPSMKNMRDRTRKQRVRKRLKARSSRLRLSIFVSNKHIYAQIINDLEGKTLVSAKDADLSAQNKSVETAVKVGELLAKKALDIGVKQVVFDRGDKKYHGRIKALADSARRGGLEF